MRLNYFNLRPQLLKRDKNNSTNKNFNKVANPPTQLTIQQPSYTIFLMYRLFFLVVCNISKATQRRTFSQRHSTFRPSSKAPFLHLKNAETTTCNHQTLYKPQSSYQSKSSSHNNYQEKEYQFLISPPKDEMVESW